MNKDNFEGTVRSAVGQGEKILGQATNDRSTTAQGYYDDAAGKARSAVGSAKGCSQWWRRRDFLLGFLRIAR